MFPKIGVFLPPKWMVKIMENSMNKWDDVGGFPIIFGGPPIFFSWMGEMESHGLI